MSYFQNERRHRTAGNLKKIYFQVIFLQPPLDKTSEDLAILILAFDDVTEKTIYCSFSSLEWGPEGGPVWGFTFSTIPAQDLLKSPFKSTQAPLLNYCKHT